MSSSPDSSNNPDEQLEREPKSKTGAAKSKLIWAAVGVDVALTIGAIAIMNATVSTPVTPVVAPDTEQKSTTAQIRHADEDKADEEAKQTLDTIASAQAAYVGRSADKGRVTFGNMEDMQKEKLLDSASDRIVADQSGVAISGEGTTAHYGASSISTSGKVFYIGDRKTKPVEATKFDPADITVELKLKAAAEAGLSGDFDGDFTN